VETQLCDSSVYIHAGWSDIKAVWAAVAMWSPSMHPTAFPTGGEELTFHDRSAPHELGATFDGRMVDSVANGAEGGGPLAAPGWEHAVWLHAGDGRLLASSLGIWLGAPACRLARRGGSDSVEGGIATAGDARRAKPTWEPMRWLWNRHHRRGSLQVAAYVKTLAGLSESLTSFPACPCRPLPRHAHFLPFHLGKVAASGSALFGDSPLRW